MMRFDFPSLLVGLTAGLAAALLFLSLATGGLFALPLFILASLPIAISGFGWGAVGGFIAAFSAAFIIALFTQSLAGGIFLILTGLPTAWYTYLLGLARPLGNGELEWYPLRRSLAAMIVLTPLTVITASILLNVSLEDVANLLVDIAIDADFVGLDLLQRPDFDPTDNTLTRETLLETARFYAHLMPFSVTMIWLGAIVFILWLAARIVLLSGLLRRPWEKLSASIALDPIISIVFGFSLLIFWLSLQGIPQGFASVTALVAGAYAGGIGMGFVLTGLSTVHLVTEGQTGRPLILGGLYALIVLISLPLVFVCLLGIADSIFSIRKRYLSVYPKKA